MDLSNHDKVRKYITNLIVEAGNQILSVKSSYKIEKEKDDCKLDIATTADLVCEKYLVNAIKQIFPSHSILTEETTSLTNSNDYEWIIDPLDGTKEFIKNIPYYYVLLSLEYKSKCILSCAYQPEIKYLYYADSTGYYEGDKKYSVSQTNMLSSSIVSFTVPFKKLGNQTDWYVNLIKEILASSYRLRFNVWDIESLIHVAKGAHDGYIFPRCEAIGPKWWDIAAGIHMVEMAGGIVTTYEGKPVTKHNYINGFIASNKYIYNDLLKFILKKSL